jgi:3-oxoacyl-(acyl-carrier-protein) synthase
MSEDDRVVIVGGCNDRLRKLLLAGFEPMG